MTDTFRELCAAAVAAFDGPSGAADTALLAHRVDEWLDRARAALDAAPAPADGPAVPEGREPAAIAEDPSDRQLLELMPEAMRDEFAYAAKTCSDATGGQVKPGIFRVCLNTAALEYARAVLARYGTAPVPQAEGEVAELVAALRAAAEAYHQLNNFRKWAAKLTRAADLLEQRQQPRPVPVAERWPTPEDCNAAQAVRSAAIDAWGEPRSTVQGVAAAALRAAADAVDFDPWLQEHLDYSNKLRAIADELEAGR